MRITDIRETSVALKSSLRNAVFDFSEMTTSVVAVITDVMRDGRPVAGYAFNSTGRYACGAQMRARFIPRVLAAKPESLVNAAGDNLDPEKILAGDDAAREAGRPHRALDRDRHHRSGGVGRRRQDRGQAAASRACRALQRRQGDRHACRATSAAAGTSRARVSKELQDEIRSRLDEGYRTMKIKVGGATIPEDVKRRRGGAEGGCRQRQSGGGCECGLRSPARACLRESARAVPAALVRGADRSARFRAARGGRFRSTTRRSAPARTCSPRRTWRTWCASAVCARTGTSSRSTCRSPTASCSSRARWPCWSGAAGRGNPFFRTAATR